MKRLALCALILAPTFALAQPPRPISFNRDVRPILSDACFQCHGPDKAKRKAKLHFDAEEGARSVIAPSKPAESELIKRITSNDPEKRMPPASAAISLSAAQIDILKRWITQGAKWEKHWAFLAPERPALPSVKNKAWPRNPIDHFVLAKLERNGLAPSLEADPVTLIRRMSLDLTGLPPTPGEVDAFVKAWKTATPQAAVEALADRLLASPRYGERMALRWLDGARYADTNGYQTDGERIMWRWRDWVIESFNANMPFDQFTIEQIAGDMLPKATLEQKIATGFNRNHRGNSEGGVIPEEYAVEYVVDRVDTTSTVWLGLAAGCARCHDHKYDPLSQKEFYQLFAYFNNVPERGKAIKYGNSPPYIKTPTREQAKKLAELQAAADRAAAIVYNERFRLADGRGAWEKTVAPNQKLDWTYRYDQVAHFPLDSLAVYPVAAMRSLHGEPKLVRGQIGDAVHLDGQSWLEAGDVAGFGFFDKFSFGVWIKPAKSDAGAILSKMVDTDRADGYHISLIHGKVHVQFVKRWLDDAIRLETVDPVEPKQWHHVFVSYDGSREAKGIKVYLDGKLAKVKVNLDDLNQNFNTKEPFRIGAGGGSRFHGDIDDVRIYNDFIPPEDVAAIANLDSIASIIAIPYDRRTYAQARKIHLYYLEERGGSRFEDYKASLRAKKELAKYDATIPTTMVMEEMPTPRDTHLLLRGEYDKKGIKVLPGVPAAFAPLPKDAPNNRLGFAKWLVARENPLTARVAVNRHWQMLFGAGLVRSVEDFGAQGDWPSHPELLDWLAVEFMDPFSRNAEGVREGPSKDPRTPSALRLNAWDVKRLLKTIVTSATYRQSSRVTPELLQRDPDNRLLARGPRFRLPADMIRDQALFAAGLLVEKQGGPSVRPYQPAGLAQELTGTEDYEQDHGEKLYRRSLYTFWKRTIAPPTLMTFDAANRETCVVRETRTNTPLQALSLMNDVTFVEAARVMAERVMKQEKDPSSRLALAWRLATSRSPRPAELKVLQSALDRHHAHYRAHRDAALKLVSTGEAPRDQKLDVAEHAAYSAVCNLILNLDEVITKE
ncbi:MAG: DUF1553 domain-containing protein [Planctomycetes bacterium]|nr:DUF1553 domain-containing protein [Planctomycetota bacterium]